MKANEIISAISLYFTATWRGVTLDGLPAWMVVLSIQSRVPGAIDSNDLVFWAHKTADVLSHKVPICSSCKGRCVLSSSIQLRIRPAKSSSSILMCPCGFVSLTRASWIPCSYYTCHRNGVGIFIPLTQTPPVPSFHASLLPTYEGNSCTSWRTEIVWVESCVTILRQSRKNFLMHGLRMINGRIPAIACCMGLKRPHPPGMPKDACWGFTDIFWNFFSGSLYCFRMDLIFLQISFGLFGGSWMV